MQNESQNPLTSPNWRAERLANIKRLYPDLFTDEGKINPIEIGALVTDGHIPFGDKFEFRWPGKIQAKKNAFTSSKARLAPDLERSVNFDKTQNVIIEGENLEVLKLLSKSYYNKIKCIYIDPPYNTGHDFVYSDDYSEGKQAYWEKNGVFRDGIPVDTNSESAGRYHSNWLNMMMPRLLLAQMMLKDDGVIFVSIDDNEVHNLRKLMDEVFGEENFVAQIVWHSKYTVSNDTRYLSGQHEYILFYSKNKDLLDPLRLPRTNEMNERYSNSDNDARGPWKATPLHAKSGSGESYVFKFKNGIEWKAPTGRYPRYSIATLKEMDEENRIWFGKDGRTTPSTKTFLSELEDERVSGDVWSYDEVGHTHSSNEELASIVGKGMFDNPKPTRLIMKCLQLGSCNDDLILDFFGGSGTSAQAVVELNKQDGGNRKFILVQIPEAIDEKSEAYKAGYKKISDITIQRVKRAGARIHAEKPDIDVGFKVFKLTTSIFPENTYEPNAEKSEEENVQALKEHIARAKQLLLFDPKGKETDLLYETLVKQGFMLTMSKERLEEFGENVIWKVVDGDRSAIVCLDAELTEATVKELIKYKDLRFIGLHRSVDTTKKWELTQAFGELLVLI